MSWLRRRARQPMGAWIFGCGALMTLGFAPFFIWPLAVASLAVLFALVRGARDARQAFMAALVWGLGHGITALYWLPWAFFKDSEGSLGFALGGGIPAVVGLALYGAVGYGLVAWTARRWSGWAGPVFVGGWVLLEMVKGLSPYGFPWLPAGAVWAGAPVMMQLASVGGVYVLSALVLTAAVLVSRPQAARVAGAGALVAAVMVLGALRLQAAGPVEDTGETVRLVQPNIQSPHKWDAYRRYAYLSRTLDTALAGTPPRTIIMPETAVAFYLDMEDGVRLGIAARLPKESALLTGAVRREDDLAQTRFFNTMVVLRKDGTLGGSYDKQLLVPFGEFIPARGVLEYLPLPVALRTLSQSRLDYSAGTASPLLETPAGTALGLICYEGIFPWHVARHAAGADYLANITNDNWFTGTIALYQHAALERLRAVETGRPLLRVANTGITVAYDGYGRERARLPVNSAGVMDIRLPHKVVDTLFGRAVARLTHG